MLVWWLWGIEPENVGDAVGGIQSNFLLHVRYKYSEIIVIWQHCDGAIVYYRLL